MIRSICGNLKSYDSAELCLLKRVVEAAEARQEHADAVAHSSYPSRLECCDQLDDELREALAAMGKVGGDDDVDSAHS